MNFKGFMVDIVQANWNAVKKIYAGDNPNLPIVSCEHTCLFHWSQSLVKVSQSYIKAFL